MKTKYFLVLVLIITPLLFFGQSVSFEKNNFPNREQELKEAKKNLKEGEKLFTSEPKNYKQALDFFIPANLFNPNNSELNYKIGVCYFETRNYKDAKKYLEKARSLDSKVASDLLYYLAQCNHILYNFELAIDLYKDYKQQLSPEEIKSKESIIDKKIAECNTGIKLMQNPVRVFIDNLGPLVNSVYPDYSPIVNADESVLFFTSKRNTSTGGQTDPINGGFYEDIYYSEKINNKWTEAKNPGKPLNTEFHDAIIGLSADGQQLYTYNGDEGGDIYYSKLDGDNWLNPKKLDKQINSEYHENSASFSFDNMTIYFSSDRPNGYGGHDFYKCTKNAKGKWGEAVNLGSEINSAYDDAGIFAHPDGKTFYFSSKGHDGMGGYDIFKITYENGMWSQPVNLGFPINTTGDDFFFSINANGKHGFYASAKPEGGYGHYDIYMVTFLGPEKTPIENSEDNLIAVKTKAVKEKTLESSVKIETVNLTIMKGMVGDEYTKEPLFATIELTDNTTNQIIATFETNKKTGKYLVSLPSGKNYNITVKSENCLFHSENIDIQKSDAEYNEILKDIYLKKIEVGSKVILKNIFFDVAKATLRDASKTELSNLLKLMNDIPTLKIEISGHTDNVGSAAYNKKLSEDRAKAVVDYLVNNGISKDRLTYAGYGFDQPIASNSTEEGKQQNRRTEFKVISR